MVDFFGIAKIARIKSALLLLYFPIPDLLGCFNLPLIQPPGNAAQVQPLSAGIHTGLKQPSTGNFEEGKFSCSWKVQRQFSQYRIGKKPESLHWIFCLGYLKYRQLPAYFSVAATQGICNFHANRKWSALFRGKCQATDIGRPGDNFTISVPGFTARISGCCK